LVSVLSCKQAEQACITVLDSDFNIIKTKFIRRYINLTTDKIDLRIFSEETAKYLILDPFTLNKLDSFRLAEKFEGHYLFMKGDHVYMRNMNYVEIRSRTNNGRLIRKRKLNTIFARPLYRHKNECLYFIDSKSGYAMLSILKCFDLELNLMFERDLSNFMDDNVVLDVPNQHLICLLQRNMTPIAFY
jgi:hypothetical protein